MELDCHTMIYNIPKKDELDKHKNDREFRDDEFWKDIWNKSKLRIMGENF